MPGGTYTVANLRMRSNVWVQISSKATLRLGGSVTENSAVFSMGTPGTAFLTNARITGVGGSFTMDLSHSPNRYVNGIQVRNVRNFQIANMVAIQNDSNERGAPSTYGGVITFHSVPGSKSGGPYYDPQGGTISNIVTQHSPYAFGAVVLGSGTGLKFSNITSNGGVPLKIETDQHIPGRVSSITASGIHCAHGHSGLMLTPHGQDNTGVHVTTVTANSCESGLRLGQSTGGSFTSSSVSGVSVTAGSGAQGPRSERRPHGRLVEDRPQRDVHVQGRHRPLEPVHRLHALRRLLGRPVRRGGGATAAPHPVLVAGRC